MAAILDLALDYVFANEGGFSNVPQDHGGATTWGITREEAARWRKRPVSVQEMREFPIDEAKEIYNAWYWRPLDCDRVSSPGIAVALFDIGIVRGIGVPPKYAQRICNNHGSELVLDGHIGPLTLAAINGMSPAFFIRDFAFMAEQGFRDIVKLNPTQGVFLRGWVARAHRLLTLVDFKVS